MAASSSLAALVDRRIKSFAYLKDVYGGSQHWLSVVSLGANPKEDVDENARGRSAKDEQELQVLRWYSLGVSLAALLPQPPGAPFVRAVLQLLEEYQHYVASSDRQFKITRARGHRLERGGMANDDDFSVSLQRSGGKVLYEYLLTPHAAHALSGVQVALSLCEVLAKIYQKLIEAAAHSGTLAIVEAVMRVDERLEEHFVVPAVKHTEALAKNTLWQSLGRLDPLFARVSGQAASVSEDAPMERLADNNNFSGSL